MQSLSFLVLTLLSLQPCYAGHAPMRAGLELGSHAEFGPFISLGYRFALHDFLDPLPEFPEYTDFEIVKLKLRYFFDKPRFWIDELTIFRFASLPPFDEYSPEFSWELELGARTERDSLCDHCLATGFKAGIGITWQPWQVLPIETFLLADIDATYASQYVGWPLIPGVGPHAGLRFLISPTLTGAIQGNYRYRITSVQPSLYDFGTEWRWSPVLNLALDGRINYYMDGWEWAAGLFYYF